MSEPSDQHFLSVWAERREETAFRVLVGRYAGFVYGSALRRVGEPELAQEIAQDVFARLAHRAAELVEHPSLAGWLHRATMLLALDRMRRRARHERKLRTLSNMNQTSRAQDELWAEAQPHLDAALDALGARDRDVLMLHFVERQTFPEIGKRFNGSADAMRMRANRALAALARMLRKKGVVIPVAMLWAGLGNAFSQAAPAALAALSPVLLTGTGKASLLSTILHTMQTTKTTKTVAAAALALLLPLPLILQQQQISAVEQRVALLQSARPTAQAGPLIAANSVPSNRVGQGINFKQLGEDALLEDYDGIRRIRDTITVLETPNLLGLIETVLGVGMLPEARDKLLEKLLEELRKRDLQLYVEWSMKVVVQTMPTTILGPEFHDEFHLQVRFMRIEAAFREWATKEPELADQWVAVHADEWARLHAKPLKDLLFASWLARDFTKACELMKEMPTAQCLEALADSGVLGADPGVFRSTDQQPRSALDVGAFIKWVAALEDVNKRRELLFAIGRKRQVIEWAALPIEDRSWLATRMVEVTTPVQTADTAALSRELFPWFDEILPPDRASYAKGAVLGKIWESEKAFQYLSNELAQRPDDDLIAGFVEAPNTVVVEGHREHGELGFRLATQIHEPERRAALLATAWKSAQSESPKVAALLLDLPELRATDRARLIQGIQPRPQ
jgi:RNA polymerase sigma factor (sigma-70 family)